MKRRINVGLRYDVYARLKGLGKFGETYSDVVSRMMDELGIIPSTIKNGRGEKLADNYHSY
jgi:hypothetical protein